MPVVSRCPPTKTLTLKTLKHLFILNTPLIMKVNRKQALMIATSMLSGEKELSDYGGSAISESKKIFDDMLSAIEMEEETTDPKMIRNPAIQCADTDEVYDRLYPKVQKPKKKVNKQIEELNNKFINQAMTILDLEKMGKGKS